MQARGRCCPHGPSPAVSLRGSGWSFLPVTTLASGHLLVASILGCGHWVRHMKLLAGLVQLCRRYCHSWDSAVSSASRLPAAAPGLRSLGCCQPRACIDVHSVRCHRLSSFGLLTPQSRGGNSRGPGPVATLCSPALQIVLPAVPYSRGIPLGRGSLCPIPCSWLSLPVGPGPGRVCRWRG